MESPDYFKIAFELLEDFGIDLLPPEKQFLEQVAQGQLKVVPHHTLLSVIAQLVPVLSVYEARLMAQNPNWLVAEIKENGILASSAQHLLQILQEAQLSARDFIKFKLSQAQLDENIPPAGSREKDLELGIHWRYVGGPQAEVCLSFGEHKLGIEGTGSDGRDIETPLKVLMYQPQLIDTSKVLQDLANLRQETVLCFAFGVTQTKQSVTMFLPNSL